MKYIIDILPDDFQKGMKSKMVHKVPYTKIPYTNEYHPHLTNIACWVLRTGEQESVDWILDNVEDDGAIWHDFKFPFYDNFPKQWVGGLAQGLCISALLKMNRETKEKVYIDTAKKVFNGLKKHCTDEWSWIYEYPNVPSILNGNLYSLYGVYELKDLYEPAKKFYYESKKNLARHLHYFDNGFWSYYDLEKNLPATLFYHKIHIELLRVHHCLERDPIFDKYSFRFQSYLDAVGINYKKAKISRMYKLWRIHGITELYKRNKLRKAWQCQI